MTPKFQLSMHAGPTPGKVFFLEGEIAFIGREAGNAVVINDPEVSRKHCRLLLQGSTYVIEDLGSTNGTFVNGARLQSPHALRPGEVVSLGEQIMLVFESTADPNATMMASARPAPVAAAPAYSPPPPVPVPAPAPAPRVQVPAGPPPAMEAEARPRDGRLMLIIVAVVIVCLVCGCIAFFVAIDQFNLWCDVVPWMVPMLGGSCG